MLIEKAQREDTTRWNWTSNDGYIGMSIKLEKGLVFSSPRSGILHTNNLLNPIRWFLDLVSATSLDGSTIPT